MKLLLTSGGVSNASIAKALRELTDKAPAAAKVGFVPTAANPEGGNKDWFVRQLTNLQRFGYEWIDVIDPSAAGVDWRERLSEVDVVFVSGGNTFHLLQQFRKSGLAEELPKMLEHKVYVGSSAGSIVATPIIADAGVEGGDRNIPNLKDLAGLGLVDFEFLPHVSEGISVQAAERYAQTTTNTFYAVDDDTAIKVVGKKVDVISEGKWQQFN